MTESIDANPMPGLNYSASIKSLISKKIKQVDLYKDRDSQIAAIEQSFDAAKIPVFTRTKSFLIY